MEWIGQLNEVIDYIEKHLGDRTDYDEIARIAGCSKMKFQHLFSFAADLTVTEYIRNRRMTLAAEELVNTDIKIIDLAFKYGYESSESFTRAFHAFHGMPPLTVRKLGLYSSFERFMFEFRMNGGNGMLGRKQVVRIEEFSNVKAATFRYEGEEPESEAFIMLRRWARENLTDYTARRCIGYAPQGHHPNGPDSDAHAYVAQMFLYEHEAKEATFHGAEVCEVPQGLYIVGDIVLNEYREDGVVDIGASMMKSSKEIYDCLMEMKGYELNLGVRPFIEEQIFEEEWFGYSDEEKVEGKSQFKLWLPIMTR
jgi:AraC-like DNA-binding protein